MTQQRSHLQRLQFHRSQSSLPHRILHRSASYVKKFLGRKTSRRHLSATFWLILLLKRKEQKRKLQEERRSWTPLGWPQLRLRRSVSSPKPSRTKRKLLPKPRSWLKLKLNIWPSKRLVVKPRWIVFGIRKLRKQ